MFFFFFFFLAHADLLTMTVVGFGIVMGVTHGTVGGLTRMY